MAFLVSGVHDQARVRGEREHDTHALSIVADDHDHLVEPGGRVDRVLHERLACDHLELLRSSEPRRHACREDDASDHRPLRPNSREKTRPSALKIAHSPSRMPPTGFAAATVGRVTGAEDSP